MKIVVLDAETLRFDDSVWAEIAKIGELTLHPSTPDDPALIAERCAGAAIVLTNKVSLDRATLGRLPDLRLVSVLATGVNIVDLAAAREAGVTVCNVPGYSTAAVAQQTVAMMLHATNHIALHADSVRAGDWIESPLFSYLKATPVELGDLTVGIIGFGAIGRRVGELLAPFGPRLLASQRTPRDPPAWARFAFADNDTILAEADILTLHCPLTDANTGFINAQSIARMKPNAWLINTARGGLVNESDLAAALAAGQLGGAVLDVVSTEPMTADNPLRLAPRCFITPHIAWASETARRRLLAETSENLTAFLSGTPRHVVS